MVRLAIVAVFLGALNPTLAHGQAVPSNPYLWFERLQSTTTDSVIAISVGQGRVGEIVQVTLADSGAFVRPWREQERRAKSLAAFIFAHAAATPPLALASIQYQASPKAGAVQVLRVLRFLRPAVGDSLGDAQRRPSASAAPTKPTRS